MKANLLPDDHDELLRRIERGVPHLPTASKMVLFDRSWYNRAGVERVMGFCSEGDVKEFFRSVPDFERIRQRVEKGVREMK